MQVGYEKSAILDEYLVLASITAASAIPLEYHSLAKCSITDLFLDDCKPSESQLF